MIYITGDTHIPEDIRKLSAARFPKQKLMTPDDYVIICGDFGGVWDGSREEKYWINWLKEKNFTILFADGNHENFDMLRLLPVVEFAGGAAHRVDEGIYHLMRGEVYELCGRKFFVFGGGESHDKSRRTEGKNWWKEEMPCTGEYANAWGNLEKNSYRVDCVITHMAPASVQKILAPDYGENPLTDFLDEVKNRIFFDKWFFGHYHRDEDIDGIFTAVFERILNF